MSFPKEGCWIRPNDPTKWCCGLAVTDESGETFVVVDVKRDENGRAMYRLMPEHEAKAIEIHPL